MMKMCSHPNTVEYQKSFIFDKHLWVSEWVGWVRGVDGEGKRVGGVGERGGRGGREGGWRVRGWIGVRGVGSG